MEVGTVVLRRSGRPKRSGVSEKVGNLNFNEREKECLYKGERCHRRVSGERLRESLQQVEGGMEEFLQSLHPPPQHKTLGGKLVWTSS